MKRKVLGRGLGALIPEVESKESAPVEIDIDRISRNPDQPRMKLDEKTIEGLAASIREHGVLQPILVRPMGSAFQLVAGERRLSAAQRAGMLRIPAVIRNVPDDKLLELALVENIQREQLNPIEEAQAYQNLLDNLHLSQEELSTRLARERSTIANTIRLLKLPPAVKLLVAEGKLSAGHARALLSANSSAAEMDRIAQTIISKEWSVRDTEKWARKHAAMRGKAVKTEDPNVSAAENRLRLLFGTKVEIVSSGSKGSGTLRIHFYNQDDLIRIYSMLTLKNEQSAGG